MGDHGRSTLDHVVAKKSRGYYCPPVINNATALSQMSTFTIGPSGSAKTLGIEVGRGFAFGGTIWFFVRATHFLARTGRKIKAIQHV